MSFTAAAGGRAGYEAHAALLANSLTSEVKAGENRGRRLNHDFVVATLAKSSLKPEGDHVQGELTLPETVKAQAGHLAIAVWVTRAGRLEPLQAVGGWLPSAP